MDFDVRPTIRLPERADQLAREGKGSQSQGIIIAILEELDRLHAIVRKHNLS